MMWYQNMRRSLVEWVDQNILKYFGHMKRIVEGRLTKTICRTEEDGVRGRWSRNRIEERFGKKSLSFLMIERRTRDKND